MAPTYTANRKTINISSASPVTFSLASNATTGGTLFMFLVFGSGTMPSYSVVDSVGTNGWTNDAGLINLGGATVGIWRSYQTVGLTTSDTITVATTRRFTILSIEEFTSVNSSPVDGIATNPSSSIDGFMTNNNVAVTNANELILAIFGGSFGGSYTWTKEAGMVDLVTSNLVDGNSQLFVEYVVNPATGAFTGPTGQLIGWEIFGDVNYSAVAVSYLEGPSPPAPVVPLPSDTPFPPLGRGATW